MIFESLVGGHQYNAGYLLGGTLSQRKSGGQVGLTSYPTAGKLSVVG
jgi:hypothetical protein